MLGRRHRVEVAKPQNFVTKELVGLLDQETCSIAGLFLSAAGASMIHVAENPKAVLYQLMTRHTAERHHESHGATRMLRRWPVKSALDVYAFLTHRHTYGPAPAPNGLWSRY